VDKLKEINPNLVILRMPGFGLDGPWKNYVGWAMSIEQASGMAWVTGIPESPPLNPGGFADPTIAMHALVALQAALVHREHTGEAQLIEVAQIEAAACLTAEQVIAYSISGKIQGRIGNRSERMAPQGIYPGAKGEWVAISIRNDAEWQKLVGIMGSPQWARQEKLASLKGRQEHHDEMDRLISEWTRTMSGDAVIEALRGKGIPVAKVLTAPNMYDEPHLKARNFYQELQHPASGLKHYPRLPMRQRPGNEGFHRFGAATLGQHNIEILGKELGLSDAEIEEFARKEIIGNIPKGLS